VTLDHHYGDLRLFTPDLLKYLKKGQRYYVVSGQTWDIDYQGTHSIGVFEYQGTKAEKKTLYLYGRFWNVTGPGEHTFPDTQSQDPFSQVSSFKNGHFGTGTGSDPVHLITSFRKGFSPSKKLPSAKLFSIK
jgi:hypothetical protein